MKISGFTTVLVVLVATNEHGIDGFTVRPGSVGVARPAARGTFLRYSYDSTTDTYLNNLSEFAAQQSLPSTTASTSAFLSSLSRATGDPAFVTTTFSLAENAITENPDAIHPVMNGMTSFFDDMTNDDAMEALERAMQSLKTASSSLADVMAQSQQVFMEASVENAERVKSLLNQAHVFPAASASFATASEMGGAAAAAATAAVAAQQQSPAHEAVSLLASIAPPETDLSSSVVSFEASDSLDTDTVATNAQSPDLSMEELTAAPMQIADTPASSESITDTVDLSSVMAQIDQQAKESTSVRLADPISQLNVMDKINMNNNNAAPTMTQVQETASTITIEAAVCPETVVARVASATEPSLTVLEASKSPVEEDVVNQVNLISESVVDVPKQMMESAEIQVENVVSQINVASESVVDVPKLVMDAAETQVEDVVSQVNVVAKQVMETVETRAEDVVSQVNVMSESVVDVPKLVMETVETQVEDVVSQVNVMSESAVDVAKQVMDTVETRVQDVVRQVNVVSESVGDVAKQAMEATESLVEEVASQVNVVTESAVEVLSVMEASETSVKDVASEIAVGQVMEEANNPVENLVSQVNVAADSAIDIPKQVMEVAASTADDVVSQVNVASVESLSDISKQVLGAVERSVDDVVRQVSVASGETATDIPKKLMDAVGTTVDAVASQVNVAADSAADIQTLVMQASESYADAASQVDFAQSVADIQQQVMETAESVTQQVVQATETPSAVESLTASAPSAMSDLSSQLAEMSYGSLLNNEVVTKPVAKAPRMAFRSSGPSLDSMKGKLSDVFAGVSDGFSSQVKNLGNGFGGFKSAWGGGASEATTFKANAIASTPPMRVPALEDILSAPASVVGQTQAKVAESLGQTQAKVAESLVATQTSVIESTGTLTLSKVGGAVAGGIQGLGYIVKTLLNAIIEAFTDGGVTLDKVVLSAERSVNGVVEGAVQAVQNTIHGISQMTLAEIVQSIIALVLFISRVLFKILSTVLELATGKGLAAWGGEAATAMQASAAQLSDAAAATATDLTTKSFSELTTLVASYVDQVGQGMVSGSTAAWQVVESTNMISLSF